MVTTDPRIERTKRVVLEAAIQVVAERGFSGASIDAIARRCGVARSTIYRHWPDRMGLLLEAVSAEVGPVEPIVSGDVRDDLIALVTHLGDLLGSEPIGSVATSMILESRRDSQLNELRERFITQRRAAAAQVIEAAISRSDLHPTANAQALADDLAAPIFFRALVLRAPVDRAWVEDHVEGWLTRHGAANDL